MADDDTVPDVQLMLDPRIVVPLCGVGEGNEPLRELDGQPMSSALTADVHRILGSEGGLVRRLGDGEDLRISRIFYLTHHPMTLASEQLRFSPQRMPLDAMDEVARRVIEEAPAPLRWKFAYLSLSPLLRVQLMTTTLNANAGFSSRYATSSDWSSMNRPTDYKFRGSWHQRFIRAVVIAVGALAACGAAETIMTGGTWSKVLGALALAAIVAGIVILFTGFLANVPEMIAIYPVSLLFVADDPTDPEVWAAIGFLPAVGWFSSTALLDSLGFSASGVAIAWLATLVVLIAVSARASARVSASANPLRGLALSSSQRPPLPASEPV